MIRGCAASIMFLAGLTLAGLGVASYWRSFPGSGLLIRLDEVRTGLSAAVVGGDVHVVYTGVDAQGAATDVESRVGPFYVKRRALSTYTTPSTALVASGFGAPAWAAAIVIVLWPLAVFWVGPVRRWRWKRAGRCTHCGYSLKGLDGVRCPECGRVNGVQESTN